MKIASLITVVLLVSASSAQPMPPTKNFEVQGYDSVAFTVPPANAGRCWPQPLTKRPPMVPQDTFGCPLVGVQVGLLTSVRTCKAQRVSAWRKGK